jgi:hypothetical protein
MVAALAHKLEQAQDMDDLQDTLQAQGVEQVQHMVSELVHKLEMA